MSILSRFGLSDDPPTDFDSGRTFVYARLAVRRSETSSGPVDGYPYLDDRSAPAMDLIVSVRPVRFAIDEIVDEIDGAGERTEDREGGERSRH